MKKRISVFLALILAFTMLFSMASCDSPTENPVDESNLQTTAESVTIDPSVEIEYINPNKNFNDKEITIASTSYSGTWNIYNYNIAMVEDTLNTPISKAIVGRNLIVEDELGIIINLFPLDAKDRGDTSKLQNAINRGTKLFDFALQMYGGLSTMLQTKGMLVDLQSIETMNLSKSWWNQNANEEYTIYGTQYAAVGDICFFSLGGPLVIYFAKDMVLNHNLKDPYELAESGMWTLDKMNEMATQVSGDLDGDDKIEDTDRFGLIAGTSTFCYFMLTTGNRLTGRSPDGDITVTINTEFAIKSYEKIKEILGNDAICRNLNINIMASKYNEHFHEEYAFPKMKNNEVLFMSFPILGALDMGMRDINFGIVPNPKYDLTQKEYISFADSTFSDCLIVPGGKITPDLDMIGYVIDSMGYYAQKYITPAFIDVSVRSRGVRDEISAVWVKRVIDSQIFDVGYIFNWGSMISLFDSDALTGATSFASSYKELESKITASLENSLSNMRG